MYSVSTFNFLFQDIDQINLLALGPTLIPFYLTRRCFHLKVDINGSVANDNFLEILEEGVHHSSR